MVMMTSSLLRLLALCLFLAPSLAMADSIVSMKDDSRDYTLEGDVVTVWNDSFLFNDGSGQVIIDVRPYTTYDLGLAGRDYVQVVGRVNEEGVLRPLVLTKGGRQPVMFQGASMLEPLPFNDVMRNTIRYRLPQRVVAQPAEAPRQQRSSDLAAASRNANAAPGSNNSIPNNSSSTAVAPVQPVSSAGAPSTGPGGVPSSYTSTRPAQR